jgi:hypothetical protein
MNTILSNAYDYEWQRTRDIESKACNSVGFTGIIFTLIIGTLSSFLVTIDETIKEKILFSSIYTIIAVFLIIVLMVLSMFFGIMALTVKDWKYPSAEKFRNMYKASSEASTLKQELIGSMNLTYSDCIDVNEKLNNKIASYVKNSHVCFLLSIILIAVYFLYIMNIFF